MSHDVPEDKDKPQESLDPIEEHRLRTQLRQTNQRLRAAHDEILRLRGIAGIAEQISDSHTASKVLPTRGVGQKRHGTAVLQWSDWHVEETVEAEKVNDLNSYSLDVAQKRIHSLVEGCLWLLEMHATRWHLDAVLIHLGGDLITGWIHEELTQTSALSPIEATLWVKAQVCAALDTMREKAPTDSIRVVCSPGNHGRTTRRSQSANMAETSYEWGLYSDLVSRYADDDRIHVEASRAIWTYVDTYDYTVRFGHGDKINYQGGVGGITIPLNKAIARLDEGRRADWTAIGHFHQLGFYPRAIVNGSLIGDTPWGLAHGHQTPQQAYWLIDAERGRTAQHAVWVSDKNQPRVVRRESPTPEQWRRQVIIRRPRRSE